MNNKGFPAQIKRVRAQAGKILGTKKPLSQRQFAELLRLHHRTINGAEGGERPPSGPLATLIALCDYPEVIHRLRIMQGMDWGKTMTGEKEKSDCKKCAYYDTCTTKGGQDCLSFKPKEPIK